MVSEKMMCLASNQLENVQYIGRVREGETEIIN